MTIEEINARLVAIAAESETAEGEALTALENEASGLIEQRNAIMNDIQRRQNLRSQVAAAGAGEDIIERVGTPSDQIAERAAQQFVHTNRMTIGVEQARSHLISSGTLATPTQVSGINDIVGGGGSIIDLVNVVNCVGMGSHKIAYQASSANAAAEQTEGNAIAPGGTGTFGFVTITPTSIAVLDYISKQAKKQTPLLYSSKVREQALKAPRKKAADVVTEALKASKLNATVATTVSGNKGVVDATTLRKLALAYGGDESVVGGAVLFLHKNDLLAFGDVRGSNEKHVVYEITPDSVNPNTGVIKDGGLSVRYCLCSGLTACSGTEQSSSAATPTMFYGSPSCMELDLFSDYEVRVSEDFAFDKLMEAIRGDVELGADVVVKNGFVALTIPKS